MEFNDPTRSALRCNCVEVSQAPKSELDMTFESLVEQASVEDATGFNFPKLYVKYISETQGVSLLEAARQSLSLVFSLFNDAQRNIAVLTAFRVEFSYSENLQRNRTLMAQLRQSGYGFTAVTGRWIEQDQSGKPVRRVEEESLFVVGKSGPEASADFRGEMHALLRQFQQDAVLLRLADTSNVTVLNRDGSTISLGQWNFNNASEFYTDLRKGSQASRKFEFECAGNDSLMTRMAVHHHFKGKQRTTSLPDSTR